MRLLIGILAGSLLATGAITSPTRAATTTSYIANCDVRLRDTASTDATVVDVIPSGSVVAVAATVTGGAWSADCGSGTVSGSSWFAITAVGSATTTSLYGKDQVYAASGLFSAAPAPSAYLEGVDVSHWQGTIDYVQVRASGRQFVIAKASEGVGYRDPNWTTNRSAVPAAGLRLGAYHFARPDGNPGVDGATAEADWFVSQVQLVSGMLVPALDLEVHGTLTVSQLTDWVKAWLQEVYAKTGVRPMIYVSPSFWRTYLGDTRWFADNGYKILWIAHWTTATAPSVPGSNWGGHGWTFWQYTSSGSVPGIGGRVDLDRFNGTDLTRVTVGADFAVSVPATTSVEQAAQVTIPISIARTWFTLPIDVAVSGLPSSISKSLTTPSTSSGSTSVTVNATSTAPGTYPYTVTATANGLTRTATGTLVVTDALPPTVTVPISRMTTGTLSSTVPVVTSWSATDPSGVGGYAALLRTTTGAWSPLTLTGPTATSVLSRLSVGLIYRFAVDATDTLGHTSNWAYGSWFRPLVTEQSSSSIAYSSGWRTYAASYYTGGSVRYATGAGAWASYRFTGRAIGWVTTRGPNRGSAAIYVDGVYRSTVSLYSSTSATKQLAFVMNWATSGTHTIKIVVKGTSGHPRVDLDAFVRLVSV